MKKIITICMCLSGGVLTTSSLHADWRSAASEKMRSSKEYVLRKQQEIINKAHAAGQSVKEYMATHKAEVAAAGALVFAGLTAYAAYEMNEWRKRDEIDMSEDDLAQYQMRQGPALSQSVKEEDVLRLVEDVVDALARYERVNDTDRNIVVSHLGGQRDLDIKVAARRAEIEAKKAEGAE